MAWLGTETGEAEIWIHPLKVAQDFQLAFRVPQYVDPIRGADVARTVHVQARGDHDRVHAPVVHGESSTCVAPLDEGSMLVLLDVDATVPLEIVVSFRTVLQYAWPAGLGGQYASWDDAAPCLPAVGEPATAQRADRIPRGPRPPRLTRPTRCRTRRRSSPSSVDANRARREFIPILVAGGIEPRDAVIARYTSLASRAEAIYRAARRPRRRPSHAGDVASSRPTPR